MDSEHLVQWKSHFGMFNHWLLCLRVPGTGECCSTFPIFKMVKEHENNHLEIQNPNIKYFQVSKTPEMSKLSTEPYAKRGFC